MRSPWPVLAMSGAAAVLLAAKRPAAPAPQQQWEYRTVWDQTDTTKLNAIGRDGWELVAVHARSYNGSSTKDVGWLYFKRPLTTP